MWSRSPGAYNWPGCLDEKDVILTSKQLAYMEGRGHVALSSPSAFSFPMTLHEQQLVKLQWNWPQLNWEQMGWNNGGMNKKINK